VSTPAVLTVLAIILFLWGVITVVRRIAESEQARAQRYGGADARMDPRSRGPADPRTRADREDGIDWEVLQQAEDEVRDLGADARPEDGWEGDDWGPGAPRKPPLV
jgi:hypothetical protein